MSDHLAPVAPPGALRPPPALLLPVVLLAVFIIPMSISGSAIALPRIAVDLGDDATGLQWVVNGFNVAFAVFGLVWGVASDRLGYRNTFRLGIVIVVIASVISVTAANLPVLDVGRFITGVGSAAVLTGGSAILSNAYSDIKRGQVFAIFGTTIGLGLALGPTLSGALTSWLSWRGVFAAHGLVLLVALVGSLGIPHIAHVLDPARRIVDFSLLRNPHFLALCLVPVAGALGYVTLLTYLPVALSAVAAMTAGAAGVFMLFATAPVLVAPMIASRLIVRFRRASSMTMIYTALGCLTIGLAGMFLLAPNIPLGWLAAPMLLVGIGFGLPLGLVDGEALASVPAHSAGTAAGVLNFMRIGSEAVFVGLYSATLTWLIGRAMSDPGTARATAAGQFGHAETYARAFHWVIAVLLILVIVVSIAIGVLHRARVTAGRLVEPVTCPS
jgi:predicted MFS family arabinose efflux permease